jgi:Amt family ammonium transporter
MLLYIIEGEDIGLKVLELSKSIDTIWVLLAAAIVMFMQPGFALVEVGFTRAKNTTNILMKNLIDFSFGSLLFWAVGFGIMFGVDIGGFIGSMNLFFQNGFEGDIPGEAFLMFQTVFAATAATIVSGTMAERTEFKAYLVFSVVLTAVIYPISGHWIWGGGWLSNLETPFHDFAGSTVVHSLGAWVGLVGAKMVGPRIGKYNGKAKAIPGQSLLYGALGVFILWFGWFGFNPGSQLAASGTSNIEAISHIFITTNLSAAAGAITSMIVSWLQFKKPSLSLTLNGALAGLVAITAGTDVISPLGAVLVGAIAGVLLVYSVEFIDKVIKIDDPVGAISVHGVSGAFGTLMVGVLSTEGGLLYGGGWNLLQSQFTGVASVFVWAISCGLILFWAIDKTVGLRVSQRVEEEGLDIYEHGETAFGD